jgi:pyruvate-formate lyase-activating enzyme
MHCTIALKPCSHWHFGENDCVLVTGVWQADFSQYADTVNRLKHSLLHEKPCGCSGCAEVRTGLWGKTFVPRLFALHDDIKGERCNCRCIYCNLTKSGGNIRNGNFTATELLNGFGRFFPAKTMFYYAPAELTVSPYKKEIYHFIRKNDWTFSVLKTSGILYDVELAGFMKDGGRINVSLDSGTKETCYKVKGVNCFEKVLKNIRRYRADGAKIELKYIVIEGLNDSQEDIDGFAEIAADIADQIIITVDLNILETGISASMWSSLERLVVKSKQTGIPIRLHSEHLSNENYERLSLLLC